MTRILIVDDSAEDRMMLEALCAQIPGIMTESVASGDKAVARSRRKSPDCVLLDYHLGDRNGLSVLSALKADAPFLPVVVLSGRGSEELAAAAMKAGATRYMQKRGLSHDMLRTAIEASVRWMRHAEEMRSDI